MARMQEGGTSADFVSILEGLPQKKAARSNAAVIEAVMEFVDSKNKHIRRAAEACVMGLMKKNNEELAKAMVEMCHDPGKKIGVRARPRPLQTSKPVPTFTDSEIIT